MRLDMHSRQEIVRANYQAYERAAKKGLKEILDRLEPVTGMNRNCLATVLGNYGRKAAGAESAGDQRGEHDEGGVSLAALPGSGTDPFRAGGGEVRLDTAAHCGVSSSG
jgi:hypothetical protein